MLRLVQPQMPQAVLQSSKATQLRYVMSTPELWQALFSARQPLQFKLGPDQFVVLGDNSARSKDSRLWGDEGPDPDYPAPAYCVTRDLLIGKALFIYWPHSWDRTSRDGIWFPFFPNFARMGFVR
jgi:signal peptidase I